MICKQIVAAVLALAVVDAGIVYNRQQGANFAYTVNSLPYVQHVLPYPAPFQLVNPVAADVKAVEPKKVETALPFVNPFFPFAPYPLINPVEISKATTEAKKVESVALPSPYLYPSTYAYGAYPYGVGSPLVYPGYGLLPLAADEPAKPVAEVNKPVEAADSVVVQAA